jgi:acetyl-CoA C-acetyltransferase
MEDVALVGACRTPVGKFLGSLRALSAVDLGTLAVRQAMERAGVAPGEVQEVYLGNVLQAGLGQNPARQAALRAGCPPAVGAVTINKVCGSGLEAVMQAARAVRSGEAQVLVAGGMESMSNAPHLVPGSRAGFRLGDGVFWDHMLHDGLTDAYTGMPMSKTGQIVADRHKVTREEADRFALRSHHRAHEATDQGHFRDEIVPVSTKGKGGEVVVSRDEGIRPDTSLEKLARLATVEKDNTIITAGNASQISDGAAAMVVMAGSEVRRRGLQPMAWLRAQGTSGVKPEWVMEAPIPGVRELLKRTQWGIDSVDLVEHNEAFATASVVVMRELGIQEPRFNVHGGAVAMGHPLGASGARVLTTLLHAMQRQRKQRGVATLCLGGGNAVQVAVERA